jgi:hypothetical protein
MAGMTDSQSVGAKRLSAVLFFALAAALLVIAYASSANPVRNERWEWAFWAFGAAVCVVLHLAVVWVINGFSRPDRPSA